MDKVMEQIVQFSTTYGIRIVGAILILIVGRIAAGIVRNTTKKILTKRNVDVALVSFAGSMVYALILAFVILAALAKFGIQTASFVAVLGAAAFAIGFALQGSLANFAAGVMIVFFKPYRAGDFVEVAGVSGVVKEVHLFDTLIDTVDNIKIFVPNGKIYGDVIKNVTGHDTRRVDLVVGISYDSDIGKAMQIAMDVLKKDDRVLKEPEPQVAVSNLGDSSVDLVIRPWVKTSDYWSTRFDVTRKIKEVYDANGIEIPFPQHTIHIAKD